jgi:hypothetical protein
LLILSSRPSSISIFPVCVIFSVPPPLP